MSGQGESRVPVMMAAQAVALSARTGMLTPHAVDEMRTRAEELLPKGDLMRGAVLRFATMFEEHKRDPKALEVLGEELERELAEELKIGAPVQRYRSDIDG